MDYDAFREFLAGVTRWAITDSPSSPGKEDKPANGYFGNTLRSRSINMSPWGSGPEPAEHEFLQRLFKSWDVDNNGALSLQNVVYGLAPIKGNRDIMSNISYFFELYDDDNDGKVDREGMLRISEALLFLSRRGVLGSPMSNVEEKGPDGMPISRDEQFLSAVSAFIRRCFEYADPDNQANDNIDAAANEVNKLAVSEDKEDDLLDFDDTTPRPVSDDPLSSDSPTSAHDNSLLARPSANTFGQTQSKNVSANIALDPASPLYITLPTFRMLVLADETLEAFFDSGFANSFHLADAPLPSSTLTSPSFLNLQNAPPNSGHIPAISPGGPAAGVVAPGKGLRGMLDNIVTDGMRVAAEVKRRMDEAQKELDRGASTRGTEDDDEDDGEDQGRDLLDVAEADAGEGNKADQGEKVTTIADKPLVVEPAKAESSAVSIKSTASDVEKSTMFER
jgi:hypothetical protein